MLKQFQFKEKDSEIKPNLQHLVNVTKDFTISNMKKTDLRGYVSAFFINYIIINTNDI